MSVADEIKELVNARSSGPEFIGHLIATCEHRTIRRLVRHVPQLEGRFGELMRQYVRLKIEAHRARRRAFFWDEVDCWSEARIHFDTEHSLKERATAKRAEAMAEACRIDYT